MYIPVFVAVLHGSLLSKLSSIMHIRIVCLVGVVINAYEPHDVHVEFCLLNALIHLLK